MDKPVNFATPPLPRKILELLESLQGNNSLLSIARAVVDRRRLKPEEGLFLLNEAPLSFLQPLADYARRLRSANKVYFATTLYIHPTNLCELSCPMCSFYAKPGWESAWFLSPKAVEERVKNHLSEGLTEIHFVGGLWPQCDLSYYEECFSRILNLDHRLLIKALTAVEYDYLARLHSIDVAEVVRRMLSFGARVMTGGGAEILVERVRKKLAPQKITTDRFLEIHRIAHEVGMASNMTMLYDSIESDEEIIQHFVRVRELQDVTGGILSFVPLRYHSENNALGRRLKDKTGRDPRRIFGTAALMLDNLPHLKVPWTYFGIEMAQELLDWGVDDLSSTNTDEKIVAMAGGVQVEMTKEWMRKIVLEKGLEPIETNSLFQPLDVAQC